jgi:hypothetical protein
VELRGGTVTRTFPRVTCRASSCRERRQASGQGSSMHTRSRCHSVRPIPPRARDPCHPPPPPPAYICVPYHPRRFCRHSRSGLGYRPAPRLYRQVGVEVRGAFVSWPWQHRLGRYADSFTTRPRSHQGREPTLATPSDTPTFVRYAARTPHSVALCAPFPADGRARSPDCGPRSSALLLVGVSSGWTAGGSRRDGTAPLTE